MTCTLYTHKARIKQCLITHASMPPPHGIALTKNVIGWHTFSNKTLTVFLVDLTCCCFIILFIVEVAFFLYIISADLVSKEVDDADFN